ncbi:MAG: hypothetical protein M1829_006326 [Trizodia sp. TS-e1964]|nr:MAG: hypothetical protein M1829_006326 [Trizodia sp. TS-e1964]
MASPSVKSTKRASPVSVLIYLYDDARHPKQRLHHMKSTPSLATAAESSLATPTEAWSGSWSKRPAVQELVGMRNSSRGRKGGRSSSLSPKRVVKSQQAIEDPQPSVSVETPAALSERNLETDQGTRQDKESSLQPPTQDDGQDHCENGISPQVAEDDVAGLYQVPTIENENLRSFEDISKASSEIENDRRLSISAVDSYLTAREPPAALPQETLITNKSHMRSSTDPGTSIRISAELANNFMAMTSSLVSLSQSLPAPSPLEKLPGGKDDPDTKAIEKSIVVPEIVVTDYTTSEIRRHPHRRQKILRKLRNALLRQGVLKVLLGRELADSTKGALKSLAELGSEEDVELVQGRERRIFWRRRGQSQN